MDRPLADWVTQATTPPSSPEQLDQIAGALGARGIEINFEENPVRQCDKNVATWLRVRSNAHPRAWAIARKLIS